MPRWTPIVYTNCKRCSQAPCPVLERITGRLRDGTPVPVVVRHRPAPEGRSGPRAATPGDARRLQRRPAVPTLAELGRALPFLLIGAAVLLIASLESRSR